MPRRHRHEEEFGSDSFLDVLANLVGILIILIVAVGVRISNTAPAELMAASNPTPVAVEPELEVEAYPEIFAAADREDVLRVPALAEEEPVPSPAVSETPLENLPILEPELPEPPAIEEITNPVTKPVVVRVLPEIPQFEPLPEIKPAEELLLQARELVDRQKLLQQQLQQLQIQEQRLAQSQQETKQSVAQLEQQMTQELNRAREEQSETQHLTQTVTRLRSEVESLVLEAQAIENDEAPVEKLTHHLPPIGRVVSGDEVHFRLQGNRVSYVPLNELILEVQGEVQRRRDILLNKSFFQSKTREIRGFEMEYVMQRERGGITDDVRYGGSGMVRIGISSWVIKPVGNSRGETSKEAMAPGSEFLKELGLHGPTTTVTFWVYPDSFEVHRELKDFTQRAGFWIASRPLPDGVPIAGSPTGSKSVAQ